MESTSSDKKASKKLRKQFAEELKAEHGSQVVESQVNYEKKRKITEYKQVE